MQRVLHNALEWAKPAAGELQPEGFVWGDQTIMPGHMFSHLGMGKRTQLCILPARLQYAGRVGSELLFSVVTESKNSAADHWYVCVSYVNSTTLLAQTGPNAFYDIKHT